MLRTATESLKHPRTRLQSPKVLGIVALLTILCACEKSGHDLLVAARDNLASASYDAAIEDANAGLAASPSKADAWALELLMLEAYARSGNGESAKQRLAKLAKAYPDQLSATDYSSTAQQLQASDQGPVAIEVLDMGKNKYPGNELIDRMLAEAVSSETSPEELEMLRSLGYIE